MWIEVYRDTLIQAGVAQICPGEPLDYDGMPLDNVCKWDVPTEYLKEYYKDCIEPDYPDMSFWRWLCEVYILDEMEALINYLDTNGINYSGWEVAYY